MKVIRQNRTGIQLKSILSGIKNEEGINSRIDQREGKISELKDRLLEHTVRGERIKRDEESLWDT